MKNKLKILSILFWGIFILTTMFSCHTHIFNDDPDENKNDSVAEIPLNIQWNKEAVLLDLTNRYGDISDAERHLYSAEHIMQISGIPYFVTNDIEKAMESQFMLLSSPISESIFNQEELNSLNVWLENGGYIISPAVKTSMPIFGVQSSIYAKSRYNYRWKDIYIPELEYFDDEYEQVVSLSSPTESGIKSYAYATGESTDVLAYFSDNEPAVIKKTYDKGVVYSFGVEWRDVIQRNQLNKDFKAQRIYSNGFEPSGDIYALFVRSVYNQQSISNGKASVWKHTIPNGYKTVIIPTHDIDSRTTYDSMFYISHFEKSVGISAHFFLTTRYFRNPGYSSAYYNEETKESVWDLFSNGHTVGSHSTGHFLDFNIKNRFAKGSIAQKRDNYLPTHDVNTKTTFGGTVYGETVLSKSIIKEDYGRDIKSFRSGHLHYNKYLAECLDEGGFLYNSSFSACDVLTKFPYFERKAYDWSGELTNVLEVPLHISDVFDEIKESGTEYPYVVEEWIKCINQLKENYAPCVLLIHPNKKFKMEMLKMLYETINRVECGFANFDAYSEFWINRHNTKFKYFYDEKQQVVFVQSTVCKKGVSFMIETDGSVKNAVVVDENNKMLASRCIFWGENKIVLVIE